jgi:hypothetical protein
MAYEVVRKHLLETWNNPEDGCDNSRILWLLKATALEDKSFSYRVARDGRGKVVGFMWQNGNMRRQLELNGGYLSLDAMKRQIVSCNWPYIAITLLDPDHNLFVGLEGICAAERNEAYTFVLQVALEMTPKLKPADIKIIAADGLLSEAAVAAAGIPSTCTVILDVYHLLNQDWPNYFKTGTWGTVKEMFYELVYAKTETEHKKAEALIRARFKDEPTRLSYVETRVFPHAAKFARCYVKLIPGTYVAVAFTFCAYAAVIVIVRLTVFCVPPYWSGHEERQGSTASEINHASFCMRIGQHSGDEPCDLVLKTLRRQHEIYAEKNSEFIDYEMVMTGKFFCAEQAHANKTISDIDWQKACAGRLLCKTGKERFSSYIDSAQHYGKIPCDDGSGNYRIGRNGSDAPPRIVGDSQRCDCEDSVAYQGPCTHTVRMDDMQFVIASWPERFHLQKTLGKSYDTPANATAVSGSQGVPHIGVSQDNSNECFQLDDGGVDSVEHDDLAESVDGDNNQVRPSGNGQDLPSTRSGMRDLVMRDFKELSDSIAFSAFKKENKWQIFGAMLKLKEYLNDGKLPGGTDSDVSTLFLSQWSSSYGKDSMFQHRSPIPASDKPLERRDGAQLPGRPQKSRMMSGHEHALANGKSRQKSCFFCGEVGHTISSCAPRAKLGKRYQEKDKIMALARVLGDSAHMYIESMGTALKNEVGIGAVGVNGPVWTGFGSIPCNTKTLVLLRQFLDPSRWIPVQSRFNNAPQQSQNTQDNIVEVEFYDAFGRILESNEQSSDQHPTFYRVQQVSEWLFAFTPSTKCLFSKLQPPQNVASSPYIFY